MDPTRGWRIDGFAVGFSDLKFFKEKEAKTMPTYVYECSECQEQSEAVQKMSEEPLKHCEKCDKDTLVRIITPTGFVLNGPGWARDGYR